MVDSRMQRRASIGAVTGPIGLLLGLVAVVIALSSGAEAAPPAGAHHHKITASDLAAGAVTAKAIARGAVTAPKIKKSAVIASKMAKGSVTSLAIAEDSVTRTAIAPGSVYGGALGAESIHVAPIADHDAVAENGTWTSSDTAGAFCAPGEALLGTGFIFTNPGNREVSFLRSAPFLGGGPTPPGAAGEIASNSGGTATAQIMALCLGG